MENEKTSKGLKTGYTRVTAVSGSLYIVIPKTYAKEHKINVGDFLKRIEYEYKIEYVLLDGSSEEVE